MLFRSGKRHTRFSVRQTLYSLEVIQACHRLDLIQGLGCKKIIVESDSLDVIQAYQGVIEIWSPYTAILADIFQESFRIGLVSFVHCPREANRAAHNLARNTYIFQKLICFGIEIPIVVLFRTLFMM